MSDTILAPRNAWYVAALAHEIDARPSQRTVLGEPVVLFRLAAGGIVAARNRCPHRFAPLHLGRVVDDTLECPYHGLRFEASGRCSFNPQMDGRLPAGATLHTYVATQRWGFVWIWMGEAAADVQSIPELEFLDGRPGTRSVSGVLPVQANFRHVIDNAMDSAHIATVHRDSLHSEGLARAKVEVRTLPNGCIEANRMGINTIAPLGLAPLWQKFAGSPPPRVDHWADARWYPPAVVTNDVGLTPTGRPRQDGMTLRLALAFTPETLSSTHYFWTICRDFLADDDALDGEMSNAMEHVLKNEDGVILEALQRTVGSDDLLALRPALMAYDRAVVAVRRALDAELPTARRPMSG